ncbi:ninjurin-1-like isoform X2 [Oratosquilla oratoria]|uniref:ninjurin-1-like isoform X2 n=1 Tax=Oratosquilla oratoria TaxID=337810 RepID=UPI003F777CBE
MNAVFNLLTNIFMSRRVRSRGDRMPEPGEMAELRETDVDARRAHPDDGIDDGLEGGDGTRGNGMAGGGDPRRGIFPSTGETPSRRGYHPVNPKDTKPLDVNLYATKKTVAHGMMDLALLTANANQLRYVLEAGGHDPVYYYINVVLICFSIILQVAVGIALIFLGRYNVARDSHARKADVLNNWVVLAVFLITIINVFISAFSIDPATEGDLPTVKDKTS